MEEAILTESASGGAASRTPVFSLDRSPLTHEGLNPIARELKTFFKETFHKEILPPGPGRFLPSDAPLYVLEREWIGDPSFMPSPPTVQRHEALLHSIFWDPPHEQLVFVEGEYGTGKTTLIDYYLRCYCPGDLKRADDFNRKLTVHFELRGVNTINDFNRTVYSTLKKAIQGRFGDPNELEMEDDYMMWDPVFNWKSREHEIQDGNILEYRRRRVTARKDATTPLDHGEEWVRLALKRITEKMGRGESLPFTYVVACLDNLDQSDESVQKHAISTVRDWIQQKFAFWQIYVPAWPNTVTFMVEHVRPIEFRRVRVGPLKAEEVLRKRSAKMQEIVRGSSTYIRLRAEDRVGSEITITNEEIASFFEHASDIAKGEFVKFLALLAGRSTRDALTLWEWTLSSEALHWHLQKGMLAIRQGQQRTLHKSIGLYELFDALLTGKYQVHHAESHPVVNLFYLGFKDYTQFDSLLGVHLLFLLEQGQPSAVTSTLEQLGYTPDRIKGALRRFRQSRLITGSPLREDFTINLEIVKAHRQLLSDPGYSAAYTDNMAMVTPVPENSGIVGTVSYKTDDFQKRSKSALSFISMLCDDEAAFCAKNRARGILLDAVKFPSVSKLLIAGIRARFEGIKKLGGPNSAFLNKLLAEDTFHKLDGKQSLLHADW